MFLFQAIFISLIALFGGVLYFGVLLPLKATAFAFFVVLCLVFAAGILNILWLPLIYWQAHETLMTRWDETLERSAHRFMGFFSLLLFLVGVKEGLHLVLHLAAPTLRWQAAWPSGTSLVFAVLLFALGRVLACRGPVVKTVEIDAGEGPALRIAQISDLHIGTHIQREFVENVVRMTNALDPDLIVLTGDIADGDPNLHEPDYAPLRDLKARFGIFYSTGNHEHYWDESEWKERFSSLGMRVLDNDFVVLEKDGRRFAVAGVNDTHPDYAKALSKIPRDAYTIFLAHRPSHLMKAAPHRFDLQLSGHTHGGQFLPWTLTIGLFHRHAKGLHRAGGRNIYVSVGTGFWGPPLRLGTTSEITQLNLIPKAIP